MKIAAVIVTYNRKNLLMECLSALAQQYRKPDYVYIFDNASTDGTMDILKKKCFVCHAQNKVFNDEQVNASIYCFDYDQEGLRLSGQYIRSVDNVGGAGGFYAGIKMAVYDGFDWVFVMDDDAEPSPEALQIMDLFLINNTSKENIAAIACKKVDHTGQIERIHRGLFIPFLLCTWPMPERRYKEKMLSIDYSSFVGLMISSKAVASAGWPRKDFFIYCDDVEYCLRLRSYGPIYLIPSAEIVHKDKLHSVSSSKSDIDIDIYWKRYFGIRNLTFLAKEHFKTGVIRSLFLIFFPRAIKTVFTQSFVRLKLEILWKGWKDGLSRNFDQDPHLLREFIKRKK